MKALRASFNALAFSLSVAGCKPDRDSLCGTAQVCSFDWESRAEVCWEASDCDHQNVAVKGATVASAIDFEPTFLDAGDGRIDLQIQVFGDQLGIDMPVSVRASGPDNAGLRHQCSKDLWIFHGIPISGLDRIEVSIPGTDIRAWKDLSGMDIEGSFSCDPRDSLLRKDLLPEFPERLSLGSEIEIRTPLSEEILASGRSIGMAIEVIPPDEVGCETEIIFEGDSGSLRFDRSGRWFLRVTLLCEDLCGRPSANLLVIQEAEILVS